MRARIVKAGSVAVVSGDPSCPAPSQPGLGLPGTGSRLGAMDDGREDVVIVGGAESSAGFDTEAAAGSGKVSETKKPIKRMSAATRRSRKDGARALTYDELIEGGDCLSGRSGFPVRDSSGCGEFRDLVICFSGVSGRVAGCRSVIMELLCNSEISVTK